MDKISRPGGMLTVQKILLADGSEMPTQRAVELGWITPSRCSTKGWDLQKHEVPLGRNLFVDNGRQAVAFAFGERSPIGNFVCRRFTVGTGTTPPKVTDVALQSPLMSKAISFIDFSVPFVVRVEFIIAADEVNGFLITEMGLLSGNETLLARRVHTGINKTSDFAPVLGWRIRF